MHRKTSTQLTKTTKQFGVKCLNTKVQTLFSSWTLRWFHVELIAHREESLSCLVRGFWGEISAKCQWELIASQAALVLSQSQKGAARVWCSLFQLIRVRVWYSSATKCSVTGSACPQCYTARHIMDTPARVRGTALTLRTPRGMEARRNALRLRTGMSEFRHDYARNYTTPLSSTSYLCPNKTDTQFTVKEMEKKKL